MSSRQRAVLWHRAHGLSGPQIARVLGIAVSTVDYHERVVCHLLRAVNITHAVHLGHLADAIGEWADCGTRAAYLRHMRRGGPACRACRAANAAHGVAQRAGELVAPGRALDRSTLKAAQNGA